MEQDSAGRNDPPRVERESPALAAATRLLRLFGDVRTEEVTVTALLSLIVFIELAAYYLLKVVREPLVMMAGGAEVKRYASAAQAAVLLATGYAYDALAARVGRMKLLGVVNLFFITSLLGFCALGAGGLGVGVPFFIWVGVFNVTIVAQFWAFASDIYTAEQGRRTFGVLGIGSALGAVAGAYAAGWLYPMLGPFILMALAAALLLLCLLLLVRVNRLEARRVERAPVVPSKPMLPGSAFRLLLRDLYLTLVAAITLIFTWVSAVGEYVMDRALLATASAVAGKAAMGVFIGTFRARFFGWVNVSTLLMQSMAARVMSGVGVVGSLFITPLAALGGYSAMALMPVLAVVSVGKGIENSLGYSLQNTARHALFLTTSREAKYKAKTVIDTFFWRAGDLMSAILVGIGSIYRLSAVDYIWLNLGLVVLWLTLMVGLARVDSRRAAPSEPRTPTARPEAQLQS